MDFGKNLQKLLEIPDLNFKRPRLQIVYFESSFFLEYIIENNLVLLSLVYFVKAIHEFIKETRSVTMNIFRNNKFSF